jgi:hypothetical protein
MMLVCITSFDASLTFQIVSEIIKGAIESMNFVQEIAFDVLLELRGNEGDMLQQ